MTTLSVPDISCGHCKSSIETAVSGMAGITNVEVHIEDKTVEVAFDAPASLDDVVQAIEDQGYAVAR